MPEAYSDEVSVCASLLPDHYITIVNFSTKQEWEWRNRQHNRLVDKLNIKVKSFVLKRLQHYYTST